MHEWTCVMEKPEEPTTANCPICNKSVPLNIINSHIDLCLLPGGDSLPIDCAASVCERESSSQVTDITTPNSKKKSSPLSSAGKSKQSVLSFKHASSLQPVSASNVSKSEVNGPLQPPPAKARRLDDTPTSSSQATRKAARSHQDHKEPLQFASLSQAPHSASHPAPLAAHSLQDPLAEVMRPSSMDGYVGQEAVIGKNTILHTILETGQVPSLIFWGPPGCGKTTLARIISKVAREKSGCRFVQLSATTAGVNDVKEVVKVARNEKAFKRKTILFIDEIHRFNKLQQDTFLPHVEDGTIVLLGATTENPSFQLNSALLSRCRVIVLEKLQAEEIRVLIKRAAERLGVCVIGEDSESASVDGEVAIESDALSALAQLCDGDARSALNGLQLAVQAKQAHSLLRGSELLTKSDPTQTPDSFEINKFTEPSTECTTDTQSPKDHAESTSVLRNPGNTNSSSTPHFSIVTVQDVKESLQRTHLLYDKAGEEHYNIISALHKSMRGSDANASLYWLARMLCGGEDPLYIARRVVRFASEDIGLADPSALTQAVAAFQGCQFIGMPECEVILAQAVVYMARAPKSIEVYSAYQKAKRCIKEHKGPLPSVPLHLRNAPTRLMKSLGYGREYKYNPAFEGEVVAQDYMPEGLQKVDFF